jgi:hypothetical protein
MIFGACQYSEQTVRLPGISKAHRTMVKRSNLTAVRLLTHTPTHQLMYNIGIIIIIIIIIIITTTTTTITHTHQLTYNIEIIIIIIRRRRRRRRRRMIA